MADKKTPQNTGHRNLQSELRLKIKTEPEIKVPFIWSKFSSCPFEVHRQKYICLQSETVCPLLMRWKHVVAKFYRRIIAEERSAYLERNSAEQRNIGNRKTKFRTSIADLITSNT